MRNRESVSTRALVFCRCSQMDVGWLCSIATAFTIFTKLGSLTLDGRPGRRRSAASFCCEALAQALLLMSSPNASKQGRERPLARTSCQGEHDQNVMSCPSLIPTLFVPAAPCPFLKLPVPPSLACPGLPSPPCPLCHACPALPSKKLQDFTPALPRLPCCPSVAKFPFQGFQAFKTSKWEFCNVESQSRQTRPALP